MSTDGWFVIAVTGIYLAVVWLVLWWPAAIVFSLFGAGAILCVLELEGITNVTTLI